MPVFKIHHITKYAYDRPVRESVNEIKIFPYQGEDQETLQHDLTITGQPPVETFQDYWGNKVGIFNLLSPHKELTVESRLVTRVISAARASLVGADWDQLSRSVETNLKLLELAAAQPVAAQDEIDRIAGEVRDDENVTRTVEWCCEYIYKNFEYTKGITTIETTVDDILRQRGGVCQDFAHLMLQILRTLRIPSRYVSGYVCPNKSGMRGQGATHAWVEVWLPLQGWTGIDPTNNTWVTDKHVRLAVGRNFEDCTPVKGSFKGPARQKLSVYVSIGYEDGNVFEDTHQVHLIAQPDSNNEKLLDESFGAQQQ